MAQFRSFKSVNGKKTDVLHSKAFLSKKLKERRATAFDKRTYSSLNLSPRDKALLNGYAFACAEQAAILKFKENLGVKKTPTKSTRKKQTKK